VNCQGEGGEFRDSPRILSEFGDCPGTHLPDKVWAMVFDDREHLIQEEKKKIRRLRVLVDLTTNVLYQDAALTREEAQQLVWGAEKAILKMFPDKQQTFDIVLRPRFERILRERWG